MGFSAVTNATLDIFLMTAGGTDVTNVTRHSGNHMLCGFLDADTIVFVSDRDGDTELYTSDLSSGPVVRLADSPGADTMADLWVPPAAE